MPKVFYPPRDQGAPIFYPHNIILLQRDLIVPAHADGRLYDKIKDDGQNSAQIVFYDINGNWITEVTGPAEAPKDSVFAVYRLQIDYVPGSRK